MIGPIVLLLLGALAQSWMVRPLGPNERTLAWLTFAMRALSVWLNLVVVRILYGNLADLAGYERVGQAYGERLAADFRTWAEIVGGATVGIRVPQYHFPMAPSATGVMNALASWIEFLFGSVAVSGGVLFSLISHLGLLALYRTVRPDLPPRARIPGFLSVCMIPSVVFWSSALLKESAVMGFVAATAAAVLMLLRTGRVLWLVPAMAAATPVWLLKPYLLAPMLIATIVGAYVARMRRFGRQRFRWTLLVRGLLPLLVGYVIVSVALPRWSPARVLEEAEHLQSIGLREDMMEGSRYSLVQAGETLSTTRLVLVAPLALATTLARPLPGEVLNAQGLAASLEIFAFLLAMLRLLRRRGLRGLGQAALDYPWVAFALIFVGLGGVGIGIGTFNLGTLARYRMPLMPFYALVVFTLPSVLPPLRRAEHRRQT